MEYTINKRSKISGISTRTLRYYDAIGLLKPARVTTASYRIYTQKELDTLQQILFYRELDFPLDEIKNILYAPQFDKGQAFKSHLAALINKRQRLDALINNVTKSLSTIKGETTMTDNEKFEGFKQSLIDKNEQKFGAEIRTKYGNTTIDTSNAKLKGLTQAQYDAGEALRLAYEAKLKSAIQTGDPCGELAQTACDLHRQWLSVFYPSYSKAYHQGLADMYVGDERFKTHYEKIAPGCATFFRDAIHHYCAGIA